MKTITIYGAINLAFANLEIEVNDDFDISDLKGVREKVMENIDESYLGWDINVDRDLFIGDVEFIDSD